jgi:hypothetical protein
MRCQTILLSAVTLLALALPGDTALAKGGGFGGGGHGFSGGGHSFSGGGHSFSSGKSYSSGSHSYSSGSHSSSSGGFPSGGFSWGGSGSHGLSSGKSYSSGSSNSSGFPSGGGGSRSGPSASNFGSRSSPSAPSAGRPSGGSPFSSGRSYSSGGSGATGFPSGKSYSSGDSEHAAFGTRPSHGNYDSSAGALKQREASRAAYTKGQTPRSAYVDPVGKAQPVNPESPVVRQLRNDLDYERWRNREYRERQYYGNYWNGWNYARPVYYYHDPFSNLFWYWLLSQNYNTQAQWTYNHYDMMDSARYRDLLAHDARIEQEINNLRQQGAPPNSTATPQNMPADLMYNDSYVQSVYNPQPLAPRSGGGFLRGVSRFLLIVGFGLVAVWLVFFKRWGGSNYIGRN